MPPPLDLTLILAATTHTMGIGLAGSLPWTGLRKEMAYFARITKRLPPSAPPTALNAVIMGRKTWDSIPARFRPLAGRLNVIISRGHPTPPSPEGEGGEVVRAASLDDALGYLAPLKDEGRVGRVFVIGGAQVYGEAVERGLARRILLTRVLGAFECDAFFGVKLPEEGEGEGGWRRTGKGGLDGWVGEEVPGGVQEEGGTGYVFEMWERVD
ncbi:dihydrofolate reductase-like domain-containing protein [Schizothecium vesticola]|uniref:Dihydrofolate reductase n=1 Tax=Schizothecium vesticola TaxID=314040 RepID=A0AA40BQH1_9PEZI|nr:dihydrofolate reductase-like domain-containing protein [Schizothecium vesticola]